jgi:hypothetical protein
MAYIDTKKYKLLYTKNTKKQHHFWLLEKHTAIKYESAAMPGRYTKGLGEAWALLALLYIITYTNTAEDAQSPR